MLSKIELVSSTIMVSNTTYATLAGRESEMESLSLDNMLKSHQWG